MINPLKLITILNADGSRTASTTLGKSSEQREKEVAVKTNKVVPVVFIPGIMGTNLWNARTKKVAWIAPNTDTIPAKFAAVGSFISALFSSAKDRQNDLDGRKGMITVYQDGPIRTEDLREPLSKEELKNADGVALCAQHIIRS